MAKIITHRKEKQQKAAIIFLHGFGGNSEKTWGQFPQLLMQQEQLKEWSIYGIGYQSRLFPLRIVYWIKPPDISMLSQELESTLMMCFKEYQTICIIAHSMGGLIAQRTLLNNDKIKEKVSSLFCFGTPSQGLEKAGFFAWMQGQIRDMRKDSHFIKKLRSDWSKHYPQSGVHFISCAGTTDAFVPRYSSLDGFDKKHQRVIVGNHLSIVKPTTASHPSVQLVVDEIIHSQMAIQFSLFNKRIRQWCGYHEKLDDKALIALALALENTGQVDKAIQVLSVRKDKTLDATATLAGLYKRRWLAHRKKQDAQLAYENYKQAYDHVKSTREHQQILYYAINVAFLALCFYDDRSLAAQYAQTAKQACACVTEVDHWVLVTQVDAALMMDNIDSSTFNDYDKALSYIQSQDKKDWLRERCCMIEQTVRILNELNNKSLYEKFQRVLSQHEVISCYYPLSA